MVKKILIYFIIFLTVVCFSVLLSGQIRTILISSGFISEEISIAGTGSMYPTFPKSINNDDLQSAKEIVAWPKMKRYPSGIHLLGQNFFPYKIRYGDIVEFENIKTASISREKYKEEAGFVKRVIALPGDRVELRDGFVKLNDTILDEPYTAKPRSTYGGDTLADCNTLTIPADSVFVLGDNRKASLDSRFELGLIRLEDIHYVLPWDEQGEYRNLWRNTKNDMLLATTSTVDAVQFVNLVNAKRKEKNLLAYKYNILLSNSSKIRGYNMITSDDFSTEATRSSVNLNKAVREAGYHNIVFAELYTRGFYDESELMENFQEFPQAQKMLYSQDYQDIGLSSVNGEISKCPVQVIVVHFGGYVPPNYTNEEIQSWQKLAGNLEEVLPSWENLKQTDGIDQTKVKQLLDLFNTRLGNARRILNKLKTNQWLSDEERKMVEDDKKLGEEIDRIISELSKH